MSEKTKMVAPTGRMSFEEFQEKVHDAMNDWIHEYESVIVKGVD